MTKKIFDPIKVFISSCCEYEYEQIRKDIGKTLKKYGIFDIYSFNDQYASSLDVQTSYLLPLRNSDIILVLIDKIHGIGEGTIKEIEEAKSLNKKILYVIYNQDAPDSIFEEANKLGIRERYRLVTNFNEMCSVAEKSILNDLMLYYRLNDDSSFDYNEASRLKYGGNISKKDLEGASALVDFLNYLENQTYPLNISSEKDEQIVSISKTILGLIPLDKQLFYQLKATYVQRTPKSLEEIVSKRFDALEAYLDGDLERSFAILLQLLPLLKSIKSNANKWIVNDIYLDIRNISSHGIFDSKHQQAMKDAQNEIDNSDEKLQFPYFDRCRYLMYQSLVVNDFSNSTESPSTIVFGNKGDTNIYLYIAEAFLSALKYGSITLLVNFKKVYFDYKWVKYHSSYHNNQYLELIRLAVINRDYSRLKKIIRVKKQDLPNYNSHQIEMLFDSVFAAPEIYQEEIATLMVASVGFIFNDFQFDILFSKVYSLSLKCASSKVQLSFNTFEPIFDAYANNINRVEKYVWTFINKVTDNPNAYSLLYLPKILSGILHSYYSSKSLDKVANIILKVANVGNRQSHYFGVSLSLCDKNNKYYKVLLPVFSDSADKTLGIIFKSIYSNEVFDNHLKELGNRIKTLASSRRGVYILGGVSEFGDLLNLLSTKKHFSKEVIDFICEALIVSLCSDTIMVDEKIEAIQCLIVSSLYYKSSVIDVFLKNIENNYSSILNNTQDMIDNEYNTTHLNFTLKFLEAWFNKEKDFVLGESLLFSFDEEDCYKLSGFIADTFAAYGSFSFSELTNQSLLEFAWRCYCGHTIEIRRRGLALLYRLSNNEKLQHSILRGVINTFIYRDPSEKIGLLQFAKKLEDKSFFLQMKNDVLMNKDYETKSYVANIEEVTLDECKHD